jgi:hypothetical protein
MKPKIIETPAGSWICENCGTYVASMTNPDCKCVSSAPTPPTDPSDRLDEILDTLIDPHWDISIKDKAKQALTRELRKAELRGRIDESGSVRLADGFGGLTLVFKNDQSQTKRLLELQTELKRLEEDTTA